MGIVRQLYQLQELELDIEAKEQALARSTARIGESRALIESRAELVREEHQFEEFKGKQHSVEWELEDLEARLASATEALYSGRIKNPKELASLQHEVDGFKERRGQLEEEALAVMERVELATVGLATRKQELAAIEDKWQVQQRQLSDEIEQLKGELPALKQQRQLALAAVEPEAAALYRQLKQQKGQAVVRVEQGTCRGCRISLSTAELQRAKGARLVQCSNCGRILFLE